jgi:3-carboxy-cis,cis-muconate cycloisomerase
LAGNPKGNDRQGTVMTAARFEMLLRLLGDEVTTEIFSEVATVQRWLEVEVSLAAAQASLGVLDSEVAEAIAAHARLENIDLPELWSEARKVGYPILPLIRQIEAAIPPSQRGRMHLGATTQDIMDTGLALQLKDAARRLNALLCAFGDNMARLAQAHARTIIAARTHAQQAVPTVVGVKFAVYLSEITRHRIRLSAAARDVAVISLFGAGGTSAAYGKDAHILRREVANRLGLRSVDVPWHVARDGLATFVLVCAAMAATASRFAREVIDLSRTEIAELSEAAGHLRGASSTMPQKNNPVQSEGVVGLAAAAQALAMAALRSMEAGHERSAGEWQIEWQVLPQLICLSSAALLTVGSITDGLRVSANQMRENLKIDGGLLMAEAYMMRLAPSIGRDKAHELIYAAARRSRETGRGLVDVLPDMCPEHLHGLIEELRPDDYLGEPDVTIAAALEEWRGDGNTWERRSRA